MKFFKPAKENEMSARANKQEIFGAMDRRARELEYAEETKSARRMTRCHMSLAPAPTLLSKSVKLPAQSRVAFPTRKNTFPRNRIFARVEIVALQKFFAAAARADTTDEKRKRARGRRNFLHAGDGRAHAKRFASGFRPCAQSPPRLLEWRGFRSKKNTSARSRRKEVL